MISTRLQGVWRLSNCQRMIFSQPSRQAPFEPGRGENELAFGDASARARLQCREADAFESSACARRCEALDLFLEERAQRLWRDVAPGEARAAVETMTSNRIGRSSSQALTRARISSHRRAQRALA
jgi:hypothetical protein